VHLLSTPPLRALYICLNLPAAMRAHSEVAHILSVRTHTHKSHTCTTTAAEICSSEVYVHYSPTRAGPIFQLCILLSFIRCTLYVRKGRGQPHTHAHERICEKQGWKKEASHTSARKNREGGGGRIRIDMYGSHIRGHLLKGQAPPLSALPLSCIAPARPCTEVL